MLDSEQLPAFGLELVSLVLQCIPTRVPWLWGEGKQWFQQVYLVSHSFVDTTETKKPWQIIGAQWLIDSTHS